MVKTSGLQEDFGRVEHVHIPFILSEDEYVERALVLHDSIARFLFNKEFAGREIKVWRNNFPTKATSLSKAYKLKNQVAATYQEAATNTEE
ncbi:hypothetical protein BpHYR1_007482, partial [Brachionus plicatilis]